MLIQKIKQTLKQQQLVLPADRILIAVSGGADSVFLLYCFKELTNSLGCSLAVAHYEHGLRGEESKGDARFVRNLAAHIGIPCFIEEAPKGWQNRVEGSKQEAARNLRYDFLRRIAEHWGAHKVALGHHADDQAETVLWHLIRGSGPAGLRGMPLQRDIFIRPLINVRREEIEGYLISHGIPWREDSSNASDDYTRNRLRHHVLPLLATFNPQVVEAVNRLACILTEQEDYLEEQTNKLASQALSILACDQAVQMEKENNANQRSEIRHSESLERETRRVSLNTGVLLNSHPILVKRVIHRFLKASGFKAIDHQLINMVFERIAGPPGIIMGVEQRWLLWEQGWIFPSWQIPWKEPAQFSYAVRTPGVTIVPEAGGLLEARIMTRLELEAESNCKQAKDHHCLDLDLDRIDCVSLRVRNRQDGDRFYPLGMSGSKKLKEFLIDLKVGRSQRNWIPLLVCGDAILWVIGYRADRRFLANADSQNILRFLWQASTS